MRKCSSAPDLAVLNERAGSASHSHQPRTSGPRSSSSHQASRLRTRGQEAFGKSQAPEASSRLGSSVNRRSCSVQSPTAAQALFGWAAPSFPPDFLREADEIAEVSNLKGITAAECFEIYGVPEDAPPTADRRTGTHNDSSSNEQGLASCLATPSTMTEELSLGETLHEHLRRYNAEQTRQVQARFDDEIGLKSTRDIEIGNTNAKLPGKRSSNRRRKSLQDLFGSFGDDDSSQGRPSSPDGHAYLSSLHGTIDDDRNRMALPERSAGMEELCRPAFMLPGQESSSGSLRHVEGHPAHIQAPVYHPSSSSSAMAAYYSSLNESSEEASANEPVQSNVEPVVSTPSNESLQTESLAPGQSQVSNTDGVKTNVDDQRSASPCQPGPSGPHDGAAAPGQVPHTKRPEPQQEPRPDHPKPQQRNNIVPLPFKVRDKQA